MSQRILITGCSGFIGRQLIQSLRGSSFSGEIVGTSRREVEKRARSLDQHIAADLTDADEVRQLIRNTRPSGVLHLASQRSSDLTSCLKTNVAGTAHLLDALREEIAEEVRVVVVGSAAEIGFCEMDDLPLQEGVSPQPVDAYGVAKLAQSLWVQAQWRQWEQPLVRVRLFNLIGPGTPDTLLAGRCAALLAQKAVSGSRDSLEFGDLSAERDYTDIRDVCRGLLLALEKGEGGRLYHLGSGRAATGRALVKALVSRAESLIGAIEVRETPSAKVTVPLQVADASRADKELGWNAQISLEQSLDDLWQGALEKSRVEI